MSCHTSGIRHYHEQTKNATNLQQSENRNGTRKDTSDTPRKDEVSKSDSKGNIGVSDLEEYATRSNEKQKQSVGITKNDSITASPNLKAENQKLDRNVSTVSDKENVSHAKESSDIKGNSIESCTIKFCSIALDIILTLSHLGNLTHTEPGGGSESAPPP